MRERAVLLLVGLALAGCEASSPSGEEAQVAVPVRAGPFRLTVTGRGRLAPREELSLSAKRSGFITTMAPDGSFVRAGQVVITLAEGGSERELLEATARLKVMEAELTGLLADLTTRRNEARARLDEATQELELAEVRLRNLTQGAYIDPASRIAAREGAAAARLAAAARTRELALLRQLRQRGLVSAEEFAALKGEVAVLAAGAAEAEAGLARVLEGPEPTEVVEARLEVRLKRYRRQVAARWLKELAEQEREIRRRHRERIRQQRVRVLRLKSDLRKTKIRSPRDGIFLAKSFWGRKVGPGRRIWRGVPLASVADVSRMRLTLKVDGRTRALLKRGLLATVQVAALPDRTFRGRVTRVGRFGRDAFEHLDARTKELVGEAGRRVFDVVVELEETDPRLRPGLTAAAAITVTARERAVLLPREALGPGAAGKEGTVVVLTPRGRERRRVRMGPGNGDVVVVTAGLRPGERVLLGGG